MKLSNLFLTFVSALFLLNSCSSESGSGGREELFNDSWKFIRADIRGAEQPGFDDTAWRDVYLPHDYSIEDLDPAEGVKQVGPFSEQSPGGASTGHVMGGTAWYRKHFRLDKADKGKLVKILFDGVYMNADVWLNGHHLGRHPYGYTAFSFDLTPYLNPAGEENVLAVQVKNEGQNSRWYSGSGIYRDVTLIKTNPLHIGLWGVFVRTKKVTEEKANVAVDVQVENESTEVKSFTLRLDFIVPDGRKGTYFEDKKELAPGSRFNYKHEFALEDYHLWAIDNPQLYTLVVRLMDGDKIIDEVKETFGVRTIDFSAEKGFLLNGEHVLLKGGNLHHDNGPLGAAAFEDAEYRRVRIMKENGFNAIRTAHNPPSKLFLEACDRLGMLVMDESFDQWQKPKNPQDYHLYFDDYWEKDLSSMVLRDRNHPSVIIWSIGNEIKERADQSGLEIAARLIEKVKEFDDTRPVTQGICSFWDNPGKIWKDTEPAFALLDVHGYNYQWQQYEADHAGFSERVMIGTESVAKEAFENWEMVEKHPYVIGDFVWTGMDYLGESGIGNSKLDNDSTSFLPPWPWYNAWCGDISILGHKKPQMYYRDVVWRNSQLEMLVHAPIPEGRSEVVSFWGWPDERKSWNWQGSEGKVLQVSVYTRCDEVKIELNGRDMGTKPVSAETRLTASFGVPYEPGELTAIGFIKGREVERQSIKSSGKPAGLRIVAEHGSIKPSPAGLAYFNLEVVDENGMLVPDAEVGVGFDIKGAGTLQAVENGNPVDMKSFRQPQVKTFRGQCQLIVRPGTKAGVINVTAKSEGLEEGSGSVYVVTN